MKFGNQQLKVVKGNLVMACEEREVYCIWSDYRVRGSDHPSSKDKQSPVHRILWAENQSHMSDSG